MLRPSVRLLSATLLAGTLLGGSPAYAQIEEITVTARKREETLQQVPVAVTAFSAAEIKNARIESLKDVAKLTPGLVFAPLFGAINQLPIIRGAAQTFGQLNVGVFIDGIYLSGKGGVDIELNDLERVEIVKGPQSALYGRNTFSGAINYVTKAPSSTMKGEAEFSMGDHGLRKGMITLTGPITDKLRFRVGGYVRDFDGWYKSAIDGGKVDFADTRGAALTLQALPSDRFTATFKLSGSREDSGQPPANVIRANARPGTPSGGSAAQPRNLIYLGELPSIGEHDVLVNTKTTGFEQGAYGFRGSTTRASLDLTYDFDAVTLTSLSSFSRRINNLTLDGDNTICDRTGGCPNFGFPFAPSIPFGQSNFGTSSLDETYRDWSQELRLSSNTGDRLKWMAGVFYYDNNTRSLDRSLNPLTLANQAVYGYPLSVTTTKSYSAFGSASYKLTDQLSLTGELRYEQEKQTFRRGPTNPRVLPTDVTAKVFNLNQKFNFTTPRVILDYKLDDAKMLYASVSRGVKTGGFNTNNNVFDNQRQYGPEKSWNYEVGTKTTWLDNRLRLNGALFYTDWTDQQVACQNPLTAGGSSTQRTYTCNVGQAHTFGVELEATAQLTREISVTGSYTYTKARYDAFVDDSLAATLVLAGLPPINFDGKNLPYVPEHKLVISPRYNLAMGNGWDLFARADVSYQSKTYLRADNLQSFGSKTVTDLRIGVSTGNWTVSGFVDNLFDDDTPTAGVRFFDSVNFSVASPYVQGPPRRLIGGAVNYKF